MDTRQIPIRAGKPRTQCQFYARGSCSKGVACLFAHGASGNSSAGGATPRLGSGSNMACRYFPSGNCAKGEACLFTHEGPPKKPSAPVTPLPVPQSRVPDSRAQLPCQFFPRGHCRKGDGCPFAHTEAGQTTEGSGQPKPDGAAFKEEPQNDSWTRELGGALIQFEDGAAVSKVSHLSDFSAVRLNNLPERSSPTSVATLLSTLGVVITADNVRVQRGMAGCSADIKVEDPTFAKTIGGQLRRSAATSHIKAIPIPVPMPRGSSLHRVDCRRVHCSWHRPTRTAFLNFGTENIARKVQQEFNNGVYFSVLGCNVKASAPSGKNNPWNRLAWSVMLTGLDDTVTEADIREAIPPFSRPREITMGKAAYTIDADAAAAVVRSLLLEVGALESWEVSTNPKGNRIKAQARFFDESDARKAAKSLNDRSLPFSATARLAVQLVISAKFKISARIYDALRQRFRKHTPVWEAQRLYFVAYPPQSGYRVLKVEGQDSRLVAQAKETLERIIGGEVVRWGGNDVWNANFGRNGDEYKKLQQVGQDHGVVVMRDRRKSQLRVFGSEERCKGATEALGTLVQECVSNSNSLDPIELSLEEFEWACRGGFKALIAHLGDNKATFDIASTPKRIIIAGSKSHYTSALAFIASRQTGPATAAPAAQAADCSVCWIEAEDPVRTSCDHVYCLDCFHNLCQAEATASTDFRISCVGGAGTCEKTLALPELQELLPSTAFEGALEASFASYIRRHPADFRYCSTPDCGQIYRARASSESTKGTVFTCTKCLIPTCTACHAPHPNTTCAEHREIASGGYEALDKIKRKLGIKDCPKCKTAMEKIDGCNHMTCRGCGIHICWVCLATFGTSDGCYAHLNREHGGIGVDIF